MIQVIVPRPITGQATGVLIAEFGEGLVLHIVGGVRKAGAVRRYLPISRAAGIGMERDARAQILPNSR